MIPELRAFLRWTLLVTAVFYLGAFSYVTLRRMAIQQEAAAILADSAPSAISTGLKTGTVLGRMEVPRLRLSAMVMEGADEETLAVAVGHVPGTALPGITGNVAIAAHRDTFFRSLKDLKVHDEINLTTTGGTFHYRVESWRIVNPQDVEVLNATERPSLTLITCYPFEFFGHAPQRYVVTALQSTLGSNIAGKAKPPVKRKRAAKVKVREVAQLAAMDN